MAEVINASNKWRQSSLFGRQKALLPFLTWFCVPLLRLYTIARREANKKITCLTTSTGGSVDNDCNSGKTPIGSNKTAGCSFENEESHPGPIFLGHVVNRSYKYRWLVAGATVIFCMTVVVIVSVAYSNIRWVRVMKKMMTTGSEILKNPFPFPLEA